ncbi:urea ABC transporter permease subunit UrtC [Aquibacillus koreensis]|uniref:Urea ABC transporter permease subunit UrtC n=1 Tax=Aquibacillus koreensis TaxID=279446 RepID=A0A9X3WSE5_9BACI|nr:urea ABC transporter permease subunit UrtC [Aquibacillus koreensis]MCT2534172.1 urea ABC transporter permease subunit UrtC [Aquibacillus koreensis]MDC3422564.1 urea ABC transporter permease subunit UrtC [Aquibacillus koreensis]
MQNRIYQSVFSRKIVFSLILLILLLAPLFLSDFRLNLLGKFLAFAILAIGLDLLWGYTGVLSLGHGIFFGLGAYAMAMYLKLEATGGKLPDFMAWSGIQELPLIWIPFQYPILAIILGILIPACLALFLGYLTFRNRINGVYFTILSQALVLVIVTLFIGQQNLTGGTSGLTNFSTFFGFQINSATTQTVIYFVTVVALVLVFLGCKKLVKGRLGRVLVGVRDGENRMRFLGYNPSTYKTFVYTISGAIAGLAGMLFVLQVGIISPTMIGIVPSIEMVLWVALGGRGTLIGPVIGAVFINAAKTGFSESYPDYWTYFLGALFVIVVVFLPKGIMGLVEKLKERWNKVDVKESSSVEIEKNYS